MNTIIVEYDTFDAYARATVYRDNKECDRISIKANIDNMADKVAKFAYDNGVYNVRFHGPGMIRDEFEIGIRNLEKNLYSENKITVQEI